MHCISPDYISASLPLPLLAAAGAMLLGRP